MARMILQRRTLRTAEHEGLRRARSSAPTTLLLGTIHGLLIFLAGLGCGVSGEVGTVPSRADFSFEQLSETLSVQFKNRSGVIGRMRWDFGDGKTSDELSPTHPFERAGEYDVRLTIEGAGSSQTVVRRVTVVGIGGAPPPSISIDATPRTLAVPGKTALSWEVRDATSCQGGGGAFAGAGKDAAADAEFVDLGADTLFVLTCTGPGGKSSAAVEVQVEADLPPVIESFDIGPNPVVLGREAEISWKVRDAATCVGFGAGLEGLLDSSFGSRRVVLPALRTTYGIECRGAVGPPAVASVDAEVGVSFTRIRLERVEGSDQLQLAWELSTMLGVDRIRVERSDPGDMRFVPVDVNLDGLVTAQDEVDGACTSVAVAAGEGTDFESLRGSYRAVAFDGAGVPIATSRPAPLLAGASGRVDYIKPQGIDDGVQAFGLSVSLSAAGDLLAVGVPGRSLSGDLLFAGEVSLYVRSGTGEWLFDTALSLPEPVRLGYFGYVVALSGDGSTLAVAALGEGGDEFRGFLGAVYVFERQISGHWSEMARLEAPNGEFGDFFTASVALSSDGRTLAVGAPAEDGGGSVLGPDDNSAPDSGAAYVFTRDDSGAWSEGTYLKAESPRTGERFGSWVDLSGDGRRLAITAPLSNGPPPGASSADAPTFDTFAAGVFVFEREGGVWSQEAFLKAPSFGSRGSVESNGIASTARLSGNGEILVVSAPVEADESGAVYLYERLEAGGWDAPVRLQAETTEEGDRFGGATAISADGNVLMVAAPGEDGSGVGLAGDPGDNDRPDTGAAYLFVRESDGEWTERRYLKPSPPGFTSIPDLRVELDAAGTTAVMADANESSSASGVNPEPLPPDAPRAFFAGALYAF